MLFLIRAALFTSTKLIDAPTSGYGSLVRYNNDCLVISRRTGTCLKLRWEYETYNTHKTRGCVKECKRQIFDIF